MLKERSERGREEVDPCWMDDPKRYDDVTDVSWIHRMYRFISYDLDDVIVTCLFSLGLGLELPDFNPLPEAHLP